MNLKIALMVAPGESGVSETHSWMLKEVQTTEQAIEFLVECLAPFLGQQANLENVPVKRKRKAEAIE
jgi:hypothetical protein